MEKRMAKMRKWRRQAVLLARLEEIVRRLRAVEKKVGEER